VTSLDGWTKIWPALRHLPAGLLQLVEDGDAAGAQGPLDLGGEAVQVERVVEDVGELEVEGGVGEGLGVEVPPDDERRGRGEVDADGAGDPDLAMEILYCCCGGGAAPLWRRPGLLQHRRVSALEQRRRGWDSGFGRKQLPESWLWDSELEPWVQPISKPKQAAQNQTKLNYFKQ